MPRFRVREASSRLKKTLPILAPDRIDNEGNKSNCGLKERKSASVIKWGKVGHDPLSPHDFFGKESFNGVDKAPDVLLVTRRN